MRFEGFPKCGFILFLCLLKSEHTKSSMEFGNIKEYMQFDDRCPRANCKTSFCHCVLIGKMMGKQ